MPAPATVDELLALIHRSGLFDAQRLDIAILPIGPPPPRFAERLLFEEDFVVAMRKGHTLARKPSLTGYLAAQHMLVSAIGDAVGVVDRKLAEQGHSRRQLPRDYHP